MKVICRTDFLTVLIVVSCCSVRGQGGMEPGGLKAKQYSAEETANIGIVREMNRMFNERKTDSAMLFFSDSLRGRPGVASPFTMMQQDIDQTFPDVRTTIKSIWADGEWVLALCAFSGTHDGVATLPHHGGLFINTPATHKKFTVMHMRIYRLRSGRIVGRLAVRDDLGMYQQLGILK